MSNTEAARLEGLWTENGREDFRIKKADFHHYLQCIIFYTLFRGDVINAFWIFCFSLNAT